MTRTASHNSALSLGSCISTAVTVLSIRTIAPLSSLSCLALANTARLTASQVSGRIALIVWCSTDFFGDQASGKRAKARNVVGYAAARFRGDEAGCGARHVDQRPS